MVRSCIMRYISLRTKIEKNLLRSCKIHRLTIYSLQNFARSGSCDRTSTTISGSCDSMMNLSSPLNSVGRGNTRTEIEEIRSKHSLVENISLG